MGQNCEDRKGIDMNHNEFLPRADFDREIEADHATELTDNEYIRQ